MPATARQIPVTSEDLAGSKGGAYAEIEVPGDYEAVLVDVEDYDKRPEKGYGWKFVYEVETPSGGTVPFNTYCSFSANARWKLMEVLKAHEADLSEGPNNVDPNAFIGDVIGTTIDFPRDKNGEPTSDYREIRAHFSLVEEPVDDTGIPTTEEVSITTDEAGINTLTDQTDASIPDII